MTAFWAKENEEEKPQLEDAPISVMFKREDMWKYSLEAEETSMFGDGNVVLYCTDEDHKNSRHCKFKTL